RQLYPTAEQSSLNFFLAVNKLGSKEDMPYQKMFKIFRLIRQLVKLFKTNKFDKLLEGLNSLRAKHGERYMPLSKTQEENPFPAIDNTSYNVDKLNISEMLELVMLSSQVVHYCNVDAQRCQDLLNIRSIISDRREMSNLSYTSMEDGIRRAGGMKVRNLVMAKGFEPEWNLAFSSISKRGKDK